MSTLRSIFTSFFEFESTSTSYCLREELPRKKSLERQSSTTMMSASSMNQVAIQETSSASRKVQTFHPTAATRSFCYDRMPWGALKANFCWAEVVIRDIPAFLPINQRELTGNRHVVKVFSEVAFYSTTWRARASVLLCELISFPPRAIPLNQLGLNYYHAFLVKLEMTNLDNITKTAWEIPATFSCCFLCLQILTC